MASFIFISHTAVASSTPISLQTGDYNSGRIKVACKFDDVSRECFIDSASNDSSVGEVEVLGRYQIIRKIKNTGSGGVSIEEDVIGIKRLQLGEEQFSDVEVTRRSKSVAKSSLDVIGADILSKKSILFDFDRTLLEFSPTLPKRAKWTKLITTRSKVPAFSATHQKKQIRVIIDTGAQLTTIDKSLVTASPNDFEIITKSEANDSTGNKSQVQLFRCKTLKFGAIDLKDDVVIVMDFTSMREMLGEETKVLLGFNTLTKWNWYLDFPNYRFAIAPKKLKPTEE